MGELSRAADAVWNVPSDAKDDALQAYGDTRIKYFLTDIEPDLNVVRDAVTEAKSAEGLLVLEWITSILYRRQE